MTNLIPEGLYCYDDNGTCPYWKELGMVWYRSSPGEGERKCDKGCEVCNGCSVMVTRCEYLKYTDPDEDTLLWDMVKECGVNDWSE